MGSFLSLLYPKPPTPTTFSHKAVQTEYLFPESHSTPRMSPIRSPSYSPITPVFRTPLASPLFDEPYTPGRSLSFLSWHNSPSTSTQLSLESRLNLSHSGLSCPNCGRMPCVCTCPDDKWTRAVIAAVKSCPLCILCTLLTCTCDCNHQAEPPVEEAFLCDVCQLCSQRDIFRQTRCAGCGAHLDP
jgi:hypothetical protein